MTIKIFGNSKISNINKEILLLLFYYIWSNLWNEKKTCIFQIQLTACNNDLPKPKMGVKSYISPWYTNTTTITNFY